MSSRSLVRGFEPFEELFARLASAHRAWKSGDADWWVAPFVLAPLMLGAIPAVAFVGEFSAGLVERFLQRVERALPDLAVYVRLGADALDLGI